MQTGQRHDNEVYYKLYKSSTSGLVTVVTMQWFDEPDYDNRSFVRNADGQHYFFDTEEEAAEQLRQWFQPHQIDPLYRSLETSLIR